MTLKIYFYKNMLNKAFKKIDKVLSFFEEWTLFLAVFVSLIALFVNVVLRYTINYSLAWSEELVRLVIIYTTLISAGVAIKHRTMIKIDVLVQFFPKLKQPLENFSNIICIIFAGMMMFYGFKMVQQMIVTEQHTIIMQIPLSILYSFIPLMGFLVFMRTIHRAFNI